VPSILRLTYNGAGAKTPRAEAVRRLQSHGILGFVTIGLVREFEDLFPSAEPKGRIRRNKTGRAAYSFGREYDPNSWIVTDENKDWNEYQDSIAQGKLPATDPWMDEDEEFANFRRHRRELAKISRKNFVHGLVLLNYTNHEIAERLGLLPKTAEHLAAPWRRERREIEKRWEYLAVRQPTKKHAKKIRELIQYLTTPEALLAYPAPWELLSLLLIAIDRLRRARAKSAL
jgi:hypothetical protein